MTIRIGPDTFAVITGGAGGIGSAIAAELADRGARIALVDVDREGLHSLSGGPPNCETHEVDVSDARAVELLARTIRARDRGANLLINCAGVSVAGEFESVPLERFDQCMAVNFGGTVNCCRAFLPQLRVSAARDGSAAICNVLSDFALFSLPTKSAYSASKHAARAFTDALGAELHGTGITVTAAYPGATATDFVRKGYSTNEDKRKLEGSLLKHGMKPAAVAKRTIAAIERGQSRVLIGADARLIDAASRISPRLVRFMTRRLWRRVRFL